MVSDQFEVVWTGGLHAYITNSPDEQGAPAPCPALESLCNETRPGPKPRKPKPEVVYRQRWCSCGCGAPLPLRATVRRKWASDRCCCRAWRRKQRRAVLATYPPRPCVMGCGRMVPGPEVRPGGVERRKYCSPRCRQRAYRERRRV